jgi:hypothetical protein
MRRQPRIRAKPEGAWLRQTTLQTTAPGGVGPRAAYGRLIGAAHEKKGDSMNAMWRRVGATVGRVWGAAIVAAFVQAAAGGAGPATQSQPHTQAAVQRVQTPLGTAYRIDLGENEKGGKPWGPAMSPDGKRVAFSRAPGGGEPVPVPKMVDPPHEYTAGEIWVRQLSPEIWKIGLPAGK